MTLQSSIGRRDLIEVGDPTITGPKGLRCLSPGQISDLIWTPRSDVPIKEIIPEGRYIPGCGSGFMYVRRSGNFEVWFYDTGTTPPSERPYGEALQVGDRWLSRANSLADLISKEWYWWNGTYWVGETLRQSSVFAASMNANTTLPVSGDVQTDVYVCRLEFVAALGATNDATNHWTIDLQRRTATATVSEGIINTIGQTVNQTCRVFSDLNVFRDPVVLAIRGWRIVFTRVGTPATITQPIATMYYRHAIG